MNGTHSDWRNITSGIPQGSVLGPILFLIFINELPKVVKCLIKLFADDAKFYQIIKSNQDRDDLQINVGKSKEWASKKCKRLHLGPPIAGDYYTPSDQNQELYRLKK